MIPRLLQPRKIEPRRIVPRRIGGGDGPVIREILDTYPGADGFLVETETGEAYGFPAGMENKLQRKENKLWNTVSEGVITTISTLEFTDVRDVECDILAPQFGTSGNTFQCYSVATLSLSRFVLFRVSKASGSTYTYAILDNPAGTSSALANNTIATNPTSARSKMVIRKNEADPTRYDVQWFIGATLVVSGTTASHTHGGRDFAVAGFREGALLDNLKVVDQS